jgi:hypothetical protein
MLFFAIGGPMGLRQSKSQPLPSPTPPTSFPPTPRVFPDSKAPDYGPPPERTPTFEDMQYPRYVMDRLRSMVSDSEKLLKLERELSARIDKSGPASLTRDDLHTLAEIEKLAHNIKWKMQLATDQSHAP